MHGAGIDDPQVQYTGKGTNNKRWLHADERGSIITETDITGTVVETHSYDVYGEPGNDSDSRFRYTGQILLPGTGLYHYKARVYHPELGRFMQTDPLGYKDGMNWYAYVGNDPVNRTDPTGLHDMYAPNAREYLWREVRYYQAQVEKVQSCPGDFSCRQQAMGAASSGAAIVGLTGSMTPVGAPAALTSLAISVVSTSDKVIQVALGNYEWTTADSIALGTDVAAFSKATKIFSGDEVIEGLVKTGEQAYGAAQDAATAVNPPTTSSSGRADSSDSSSPHAGHEINVYRVGGRLDSKKLDEKL